MKAERAPLSFGGRRMAPTWRVALVGALVLLAGSESAAQDAVLDGLREQRQRARTAEVIREIGVRAEVFGPTEVKREWAERRRQLSPAMPRLLVPQVPLPPLSERPERVTEEREAPATLVVEDVTWDRVAPGEEHAFLLRFSETLWTSATTYARTPIDTMATPVVRARLNGVFGAPTRTPVARSRPTMQGGSAYVQFEYWFVVNDTIPFVVMDRDGPFGRGLTLVADEEHAEVLPALVEAFAKRLTNATRLMPYVDYYQSQERNAWFRTGFDGEEYYIIETDRPRWARRGQERAAWYDFR